MPLPVKGAGIDDSALTAADGGKHLSGGHGDVLCQPGVQRFPARGDRLFGKPEQLPRVADLVHAVGGPDGGLVVQSGAEAVLVVGQRLDLEIGIVAVSGLKRRIVRRRGAGGVIAGRDDEGVLVKFGRKFAGTVAETADERQRTALHNQPLLGLGRAITAVRVQAHALAAQRDIAAQHPDLRIPVASGKPQRKSVLLARGSVCPHAERAVTLKGDGAFRINAVQKILAPAGDNAAVSRQRNGQVAVGGDDGIVIGERARLRQHRVRQRQRARRRVVRNTRGHRRARLAHLDPIDPYLRRGGRQRRGRQQKQQA